jgi:hypothetical protein
MYAPNKKMIMGAPSPELVDHWLAKAFNAHDVEAAAAMGQNPLLRGESPLLFDRKASLFANGSVRIRGGAMLLAEEMVL